MLLATASAQELTVVDPTGCIDDTLVEGELEMLLGDAARQLSVTVEVSGAEPRQLNVQAHRTGDDSLMLRRELAIPPVDCPLGPSLIARTVQRGLDALPGWSWGRATERTWLTAHGGAGLGTGPALPALHLDLGVSLGLPGRLRVPLRLRGLATGFTEVGTGQAQVIETTVGTGIAMEVARRWLWPHVILESGIGFVRGRNFESNQEDRIPRFALRGGVDLGLTDALGLTVEGSVPLIRGILAESGTDVVVYEPPLRLALAVTLRWTRQ